MLLIKLEMEYKDKTKVLNFRLLLIYDNFYWLFDFISMTIFVSS